MSADKLANAKNIQLVNFKKLDEIEIQKIQTLLAHKVKKLRDFSLLKLNLRIHKHQTEFIHEIKGELLSDHEKNLGAVASDKNVYKALNDVMTKLGNEIQHSKKTHDKIKKIRKNKKFKGI